MRTLPAPSGSDCTTYVGFALVILALVFAFFAPAILSCSPAQVDNRAKEGAQAAGLGACVTKMIAILDAGSGEAGRALRWEVYSKCADDVDALAGKDGGR